MNIVLDTNVISVARCLHFPACHLILGVLNDIKIYIIIDGEKEIVEEYRKYIDGSRLLEKWFKQMNQRKKFKYFTNKINNKIRESLVKLDFHKNDFKFVGVAINSKSDYIIIEADNENWDKITDYLRSDFNINISDCHNFTRSNN